MTNSPEREAQASTSISSTQSEPLTGKEKLRQLLQSGSKTLQQQIHYLLMISQLNRTRPATGGRSRQHYTIQQARLQTLAELAPGFSLEQIRPLLREIYGIADVKARVPLLLRFAAVLPDHLLPDVVETLSQQIPQIPDYVVRVESRFALLPLMQTILADTASPAFQRVYNEAVNLRNPEARTRSLVALAPLVTSERKELLFKRLIDDLAVLKNDVMVSKLLAAIAPYLSETLYEDAVQVASRITDPREQARAFTILADNFIAGEYLHVHEHALNAIERIEAEEERAEALISFAPALRDISSKPGYIALLEKALISAVILPRRHIRARVLVALAPYLTLDMQGEALAAIHDLSSERERAELLAKLAVTLPADLLVASLAVAHTMQEQDSRVQALSALASHVPEVARRQTVLDTLAAASNLPNQFERVRILVDLLPILPENMREQALRNAAYTATSIENDHSRARALTLVIPHINGALLERCINSARAINAADQRLPALIALAGIPDDTYHQTILDEIKECIRAIRLPYKQARAVIAAAPILGSEDLLSLEPLADHFDDAVDQINVYIALAHHLPPDRRHELVRKALSRIQRIDEPYDRASAIASTAPLLAEAERAGLPAVIAQTVHAVSEEYDKASVIALLAPLLAEEKSDTAPFEPLAAITDWLHTAIIEAFQIPDPVRRAGMLAEGVSLWLRLGNQAQTVQLWHASALQMADLPLPDTLLALSAYLPLLRQLGGEELIKNIAYLLGIR